MATPSMSTPRPFPRASRMELRERQELPELLDLDYGDIAEAARSLDDLQRVNQWLFGVQATLGPLLPRLRQAPKPVTVLDLGTGSGQLSAVLARWAARNHVALRIVPTDINPRHLTIARQHLANANGTHLCGADAFALPLPDQSVDYVISSLILHHFPPDSVVALLREARRVARRGLVMSDLLRHPLPYCLFRYLVRPLMTRSPITAYDSEASFRRGYTCREMAVLAAEALPAPRVSLHPLALRLVVESEWG